MDLARVYERILTLVPVDELHDSYNDVLNEEISSINRAVNDISAAFAKLEEVREAVHKLNNGLTGTRSTNLTETMNNAMKLQRELNEKLELIFAAMAKSSGKRKKTEKPVVESATIVVKTEEKGEDIVPAARSKRERFKEEEAKSKTDEVEKKNPIRSGGATKAGNSQWVSELTVKNCLEKLRMMTQLSVVERSRHIAGVLSKLTDIVPDYKEREQMSILKYVVLWANLSAGQGEDLTAYDRFYKAMMPMIDHIPRSDGRVGLKRLNDSLFVLLREHETQSTVNPTEVDSSARLRYEVLVWRVNAMPPSERAKHIHEVITSLKQAMSRDADGVNAGEMFKGLKTVRQWAENDLNEPGLLKLYGELAEQVQPYIYMVNKANIYKKISLYSEMQKLKNIAGITSSEKGQAKAERILAQVKQLKGRVSVKEIDDCILMLGEVIQHRDKKWKPRSSPIVTQCYDRIMKCLRTVRLDARNQRVKAMKKWQLKEE